LRFAPMVEETAEFINIEDPKEWRSAEVSLTVR